MITKGGYRGWARLGLVTAGDALGRGKGSGPVRQNSRTGPARMLPGQAEAVRIALASCWSGARKEAYQDALRRAGIIRDAVWIQPGPGGDVAVVYLEADDVAAAFTIWGTRLSRSTAGSATASARSMASPWTTDSPCPSWCSTSTRAESDPRQERMRT